MVAQTPEATLSSLIFVAALLAVTAAHRIHCGIVLYVGH